MLRRVLRSSPDRLSALATPSERFAHFGIESAFSSCSRVVSGSPFRPRLDNQRRKRGEEANYIYQITGESGKLHRDEPYMGLPSDVKIRPFMDRQRARRVQQKNARKQYHEVQPLIAPHLREKLF